MIKEWLLKNVRNVKTLLKLTQHGLEKAQVNFVIGSVLLFGVLNIYGEKTTHNTNHSSLGFVLFVQKSLIRITRTAGFVLQVVEVKPIVEKIITNIVVNQHITVFIGGYFIIMAKLKNVKTIIVKKKVQFLSGHCYGVKNMNEKRKIFGNYVRAAICSMTGNHLLYLKLN